MLRREPVPRAAVGSASPVRDHRPLWKQMEAVGEGRGPHSDPSTRLLGLEEEAPPVTGGQC